MRVHPVFNLYIPVSCPGIPSEILDPRVTWKDKNAYDAKAQELSKKFKANFAEYEPDTEASVTDMAHANEQRNHFY